MLFEIAIENVALIDKLRLELGRGFNVLTGETGAGKSIVVGALTMVLGARGDKSLVRSGCDKARVEAVFDVSFNEAARAILAEMGLEAEDGVCTVAREISSEGRGLCRVCGSVVQLSFLKRLAGTMVELHGQNEHQQLMDPSQHLSFLDSYAGNEHALLLGEVARAYEEYSSLRREHQQLKSSIEKREQIRETLAFQLEEIDAVKPKIGEDEHLEKKSEV
ncbi:MAG: AAA family ATPase, partial [Clostridia bacterium]|nr:AAA family ATPase [Clostridia bacterium]